jgi:hypothetical protein
MKEAFAKLQQIEEEESDVSEDLASEGESHFLFQFVQDLTSQPPTAEIFKQSRSPQLNLDLREVILLDSQSIMDLICKKALVTNISKSNKSMRLQSNGGTMIVNYKATMKGYLNEVWFNSKAITNILTLSNVVKQYRVTYDSEDKMFVVHRRQQGMPSMKFRMHRCGLHYYDPRGEAFTFINPVSGNKEGFMNRQIKNADTARTIYATLGYPSWKAFRWVGQSNRIKDCPVIMQDVDTSLKTWGKNITPLKPLLDSKHCGPMLNLASSNEHVPEIERRNRVVKERCRAIRHTQ